MTYHHLSVLVHRQAEKYGDKVALKYRDYETAQWIPISWKQFSGSVRQAANAFVALGVEEQENIGIFSQNKPEWFYVDFGAFANRAVTIPFYATSSPAQAQYIINDAQIRFLFVGEQYQYDAAFSIFGFCTSLQQLIIFDRSVVKDPRDVSSIYFDEFMAMGEGLPHNDTVEERTERASYDDLANILYTSGTTGFSKGVMLTGNNLAGNVTFGIRTGLLKKGDKVLSFLPLAHAYGCAFDFLTATAVGTHVTLLGKVPSPKILMKAFEEVKPNLIITVPLVIEKIYKNVIQPIINKKSMKWALSIPLLDGQIYGQIRKKLVDALGGRFKEVIIGGAAMNPEVEEFFHRIKFPFNIGYGMTECGPLISYAPWNEFVPTSSGRVLDIMEARIYKENPDDRLGEIQVRGENVMVGYYKNPEATKEVFTEDGWLRTGDLGTLDENNNLYIRGRSKTMILSSSGQNIFPEEIEARLNNMPFVLESLVIERNKKLVALVYADYEALDSLGLNNPENIKTIMDENLKNLNNSVAAYEKISQIQLYPTEFEKTPKRSIKRYLYNSIAED